MVQRPQRDGLQAWRREAEKINVAQALLYFRQQAGLSFDRRELDRLEKRAIQHYKAFVTGFGRSPEVLFNISSLEIAASKTYKLHLKLSNLRMTKIASRRYKVNGAPVNWGSWRQFASGTDDSKARKEVFDDFLQKSSALAPTVRSRFDAIARSMSELGTDPLANYLASEGIEYDRLVSLIDALGRRIRPAFGESLARFSQEILGRASEYYDDLYFFRARVFRKYAGNFLPKVDPVGQIVGTMAKMGLDARAVKVDDANRKGKSPSAFCFPIRIPSDVRIAYRRANPLEDFTGIFHEMGHGIHFSSILGRAPYEDKYGISKGVAETFSLYFESLLHDKDYLQHGLGLSELVASDLADRFRFVEQFTMTFYAANAIMKLRYWKDRLSVDEASKLYSDLTAKYMGVRYPGEYWLLHHMMPEDILYTPAIPVATVRAFELKCALSSMFGQRPWQEKGAGQFLLELMRPGRRIQLDRFSRLDPSPFIRSLTVAAS